MRASGSTASPKRSDSSRTFFFASRKSSITPAYVGSSARTMFSATVITGISMKCWCTMPMPASIASFADEKETFFPFSRMSPSSGW